jgi:Cu/Ag efflux protein CusF
LASDVSFPARKEQAMAMGRSGTDPSAMNHEEGFDPSAMGPSAAAGTADMSPSTEARGGSQMAQAGSAAQPSGSGTINSVDIERRTVNISHEPIPAIGWPAMTMDMAVAPSVDLEAVVLGSQVIFSLSRGGDGVYMIDSLNAGSEGGSMPGMDHGGMDHGESMPGMRHQ